MGDIVESLIDIDQLVYASASVGEKKNLTQNNMEILFIGSVRRRAKEVQDLVPSIKIHRYFVTGKRNFRKRLRAENVYKGNRPPKPKAYEYLHARAIRGGAIVDDFLEADDLTAMRHHLSMVNDTYSTVLVDQDKDLDQVAGWRIVPSLYRHSELIREPTLRFITIEDAHKSFYTQLLSGDAVDNIAGFSNIGKVRANEVLAGAVTEWELWDRVVNFYFKTYLHQGVSLCDVISKIISRCALLYLKRGREDVFIPPLREKDDKVKPKGSGKS